MTKLTRIKQRLFSHQGQKISLALLIVSVFFFASTFAQTETTTQSSEILKNAQYIIEKIEGLASRIWIILATLAGKFMTNDMIYGSWLHLDAYLWKLRNICKNFANFGLLGILLRQIIQYITKKSGSIQSIITKSVVAGILIQASWFILAAVIDISTVATAAVGSFPSQFIDSSAFSKDTITKELANNMKSYKLVRDKEGKTEVQEINVNNGEAGQSAEERIDKIMPKNDSIAGPLVYIGASTLNIQKALNNDVNQEKTVNKTVATSVLQFLAIGIYCITLILLLIANIIRIGLLRVIIPISPILILMFSFDLGKGGKGLAKNFNPAVILNAIFKPVVFTAILSLILILIVSMQNIMTSGNNKTTSIQGVTFSSSGQVATMSVNNLATININDAVFKDAGNISKNIFSNIIIYFATIFLLRSLVKIAAKSGGGSIGEAMDKSTKMVEHMATTVPIIGGYSANAYIESSNAAMKAIGKNAGIDLNYGSSNFGKMDNKEYMDWLDKTLNMRQRNTYDISELQTAKNLDKFLEKTNTILGEHELSYKSDSETFQKRETLLNNMLEADKDNEFIKEKQKYFTDPTAKLTTQNLNSEGFKKLHEKLNGSGTAPTKYEDFLKQTYGKSKE